MAPGLVLKLNTSVKHFTLHPFVWIKPNLFCLSVSLLIFCHKLPILGQSLSVPLVYIVNTESSLLQFMITTNDNLTLYLHCHQLMFRTLLTSFITKSTEESSEQNWAGLVTASKVCTWGSGSWCPTDVNTKLSQAAVFILHRPKKDYTFRTGVRIVFLSTMIHIKPGNSINWGAHLLCHNKCVKRLKFLTLMWSLEEIW